jgi:vitamin B12 transporter
VVTAGLQPISITDVASSITVISREEIEQKQVLYLSELLRDVPGFAVSQAGGAGSQTQVRVRGAEANHLLVLIDGVRANDPSANDEFQYQFALTSNIERIEIIRGPQSATWGSDAVAGVINIIRKKTVDSHFLSGNVEAGSFDTFSGGMEGGYSGDALDINAAVSFLDTGGTNISRNGGEKDGAENITGNMSLQYDASDAIRLRLSANLLDASSEYDDIDYFVTGLPVDADRLTETQQSFLSGTLNYEPPQSHWSANLSVNWMDSDNDNFSDGNWTSATAAETLEFRIRGGVSLGDKHNHRVGFALEREEVDFSQRGQASLYGDPNQDQSYQASGYALEYVGKPMAGFTWTASARLDDYSDFDDARTWQLAASYQISAAHRLRGSVGTGSKTPTFTERYGFFEDLFLGNPDLKPESSRGWEIGLESNWSDNRHQLQLAYFDQNLQDEIDGFVFDPDTFLFTARNKDTDSKRRGIETIFDTRLGKALTLAASYTYTDATEKDGAGQSVEEVRRPKHMGGITANYRFADEKGNLNLNLQYNGSQQDIFFSPQTYTSEFIKLDAYTLLNLAASWKLTQSLELTGRVSNLLDEDYEEVLGFARPGRGVYAGLRGRFGF